MVEARSGADYTCYITVKAHAHENDEDNSEWRVAGGEGGLREKCRGNVKRILKTHLSGSLMRGSGTKTLANIPKGLIKIRCDPIEKGATEVILVTAQKRPAN